MKKLLQFGRLRSQEKKERGPQPVLAVLPGIGLGPLRFGMSQEDIEGILGKAEDLHLMDHDSVHLYYPGRGITLFLDREEDWRLSGIEINSRCRCTLFSQDIFSMSRGEIEALLAAQPSREHRPPEPVLQLEVDGTTSLESRNLAMTFYFEGAKRLVEINWGLWVNAADEVVWPTE